MRHVVKKQVIELTLNSSEDAFQVQNEMSRFYQQKILPELEKIFDQLSDEDHFIHLDKLEIELGLLGPNHFSSTQSLSEIVPGIISKIKDEIMQQANKSSHNEAPGIVSQWIHYMKNGYLGWNTLTVDASWNQKVLETFAADYNAALMLRKLINTNENAVYRIAMRHDEDFLKKLIEVLTAEKQERLVDFINELTKMIGDSNLKMKKTAFHPDKIRKRIWTKVISVAAKENLKLTDDKIISLVTDPFLRKGSNKRWLKLLEPKRDDKKKNESKPVQEVQNFKDDIIDGFNQADSLSSGQPETAIPEDGIFVENAGLVLLHPFLASLFGRLHFTNDENFIDEAARQKTMVLLHYLATGKDVSEEYQLVIPKLLIGFPLENVIIQSSITEEEKEEAENLLNVIIEKWDILKNTSIATLRESFLQRKGKLYAKNKKNCLQMETESIDVLLDHLPWNLSIIKLPWMKEMLRVEWR